MRADWSATEALKLSGEYVHQTRYSGDVPGTHPKGWYGQAAYSMTETSWTPELSYRYAHFDGDNLDTPGNEEFATIAYGFTGYGSWFQGEISGNYPLGNSNLKSQMVRLQLFPKNRPGIKPHLL